MSVSPATASISVICVVSGEPNTISVVPDVSRSISTSIPVQIESNSTNLQPAESLLPSEPLGVLQPTDTDTQESYSSPQLSSKLDTYEPVTNSDIPVDSSRNITEEQTSCLIISSAAKCSLPGCENDAKSLLLFKVDDDSFVALCTRHSLTDTVIDTEKENTDAKDSILKDMCTQVLDNPSSQESSNNVMVLQEPKNTLSHKVEATEANLFESGTHSQLLAKPAVKQNEDSGLKQLISESVGTLESCDSNLPAPESMHSGKSSSEMCLSEHLSSMMELDSGIPGLSGPIVDESFSLAQIEFHCPLCEEQFLCMDDYVTHLESCHN